MKSFSNNTSTNAHHCWYLLAQHIRNNYAPHEQRRIKLHNPQFHPQNIPGFIRDIGIPAGDKGDWRLPLPDDSGLHVQENYDGSFSVHWDRVDPTPNVFARLRHGAQDAPVTFMLLSTAAGAIAGYFIGGKKGARVGGLFGLGIGATSCHALRLNNTFTTV